jgi:DNA polymerase III delta prime subunit
MATLELREDQREIVKKLVEMLKSNSAPWVALQAPTGWGKTLVGLAVIKEMGLKPALWLTPRLSISLHVYNHAADYFGLKCLATAGKEKMCAFNRSIIDFAKGVCRGCPLNKPVRLGDLQLSFDSLDFGKVREYAEQMGLCPYLLQSVLERRNFDLLIAHYHRANKLVRAIRPRMVVVDESHNLVIPRVHQIEARVLSMILEKIGFSDSEILIQSPEALKAVLTEMLDMILTIDDDELRPYIEEVVGMLQAQVWYYDPSEDTINALEVPEISHNINAKAIFLSATLPPQMVNSPYAIIIHRGWNIPAYIDAKFVLSYESVVKRRDEIKRYIKERYLTGGGTTIVFTTLSREGLIDNNDDNVVWEDEITESPCHYKNKTVVLKVFGRFNEGIDIDCADRLVVLGLPLLPPGAMQRLAARGIDAKSFIATVLAQIIGRVVRTAERPPQLPEIYLVDRRFRQFEEELRNYEIQAQLET